VSGGDEAARHLRFARGDPNRAIVEFDVDGSPAVHAWDLASGRVVTAARGRVTRSAISPDGAWVWWFEPDAGLWWRRPFGASLATHPERPLRLGPAEDSGVALGADGTAIVARPLPGIGHTFTLMPVGRVRPGAEPAFLCTVPALISFHRSDDDALLAVDTGAGAAVYSASTGAVVAEELIGPEWSVRGFTGDNELLLARGDGQGGLSSLRLWSPATGLRRAVSLAGVPGPQRAAVAHGGRALVVEAAGDEGAEVYLVGVDGSGAQRVGPTHGAVAPGSAVGGPGGVVYGQWSAPDLPARLVNLTAAEERLPAAGGGTSAGALHRRYPPVVGGYGPRP